MRAWIQTPEGQRLICQSYNSGSDVPAPPVRSWWAGTAWLSEPEMLLGTTFDQTVGLVADVWERADVLSNLLLEPNQFFVFSKSTSDGLRANKPWAVGRLQRLHRQLEARGCSRACQLLTSWSAFSIPALFDLCQYWFSEERISELRTSTSSCPLLQIVSLHENISLLTCSQQTSTESHV